MGRVDKNRVAIVLDYIHNQRLFYKKDLDYLCQLMGLRSYSNSASSGILHYFPHITMCKVWNSSNSELSKIHSLCPAGKQVHYWWNSKQMIPNRNWVLCEYHPQNQNDVELMIDILNRKGYKESEAWPPCGQEWYTQTIEGQPWPYLFWAEPSTRD